MPPSRVAAPARVVTFAAILVATLPGCGDGDVPARTRAAPTTVPVPVHVPVPVPVPVVDELAAYEAVLAARPAYAEVADELARLAIRYLAQISTGAHRTEVEQLWVDAPALVFRHRLWARASEGRRTDVEVLACLAELLAYQDTRREPTVWGETPVTRRLPEWLRASGTGIGLSEKAWVDPWIRSLGYACGRIPVPVPSLRPELVANVAERELGRASYGAFRAEVTLVRSAYVLEIRAIGPTGESWGSSFSAEDAPLPVSIEVRGTRSAKNVTNYGNTAREVVFREAGDHLRKKLGTAHAESPLLKKHANRDFAAAGTLAKSCAQMLIDVDGRPMADTQSLRETYSAPARGPEDELQIEIRAILASTEVPVAAK